jgi:hypothetical protein
MPGYLDQYGAGEERRNRIIARSIISALLILIVGSLSWYLLKNHHQEGVVKRFVDAVRARDYVAAYHAWGCSPEKPCTGYAFNSFLEDWGSPDSLKPPARVPTAATAPDPAVIGLTDSESCNNGVLLTVAVNPTRQEKLWVDKSSDSINFAPYPVCPHKNPFAIMMHRTVGQLRKPLLR